MSKTIIRLLAWFSSTWFAKTQIGRIVDHKLHHWLWDEVFTLSSGYLKNNTLRCSGTYPEPLWVYILSMIPGVPPAKGMK